MKARTTLSLSDRCRDQLADLVGDEERAWTRTIERAVDDLHQREATGDLWVGTGVWQGWRVTTAHAASSHGQPVLVRPDGTAMGPGDIR